MMEPAAEVISDEWSSLSGLYTAEEADFMKQLLGGGGGNCSVSEQLYENSNLGAAAESAFWPGHESSTIVSVTKNNNNNNSTSYFANPVTNISMGFISLADSKFSPYPVQGNDTKHINEIENTDEQELGLVDKGKEAPAAAHKNLQQAQKERQILASEPQEDKTRSMEKSGKRSRSHNEVPKNKRNVKSNKRSASISTEEAAASQDQTLSSCCSDGDGEEYSNNASLCGGASSSLSQKDSAALKSRSSRGTAADPQSLYARRRRERINERLRILQNLVPNGTKVDISTMLEEAVQYVKFLQLQIKLLSSDELWMYAPIAYNGMNIGLQLSITPTKEPKHVHSIAIKENAAV